MKTVLVTGASRGIGRQIAIDFAQKGHRVIANYHKSENLAKQLQQEYPMIIPYACDMADYAQVQGLYGYIQKEFGALDIVVNNAGISYFGLLQDMQEFEILSLLQADLNSVVYSCKQAAKLMVPQHTGVIVNISSIWGVIGASCESVYSAAKGGVITFSKALAKELAPSNIRVNCVSPGVIQTDMLNCFSAQELQALAQETPLLRLGKPQDVSHAVQFLCSENASFITGNNLIVDGGFVL